jgi:hypothetical protein
MLDVFRWTGFVVLVSLFGLIMFGNWLCMFGTLCSRKPTSFVFPFFCGPLCALAWLLCPDEEVRWFAWVPLVLDPTISLMVLAVILHGVARLFGLTSPFDRHPRPE